MFSVKYFCPNKSSSVAIMFYGDNCHKVKANLATLHFYREYCHEVKANLGTLHFLFYYILSIVLSSVLFLLLCVDSL